MSQPKAIVIGASRGIGQGLVQKLKQAGYDTYRTVRSEPSDPKTFRVDLGDLDAESSKAAAANFETLDVLIVNAAIAGGGSYLDIDPQRHRDFYQTNVIGPVAAVQAFLPALRKGQQKMIVFISSKVAQTRFQLENARKPAEQRLPLSTGPYGATKAALNMVGVQLWNRISEEGFSVLMFHPGLVRTDMSTALVAWVDENPDRTSERAITVDESTAGVVQVIQASIAAGKPEFRFVQHDGEELEV
ncbi:hypothetical protein OC846_001863 [Tilletia horrida]|uniref:Short-chain dehydrogenase n=1 Tax=Tilletia horrida TaxID=155126 RepID=A0AAN6GV89_9BASI|nr:hypothetical protein OC846_001863 [Tilletia horrida]KAK0568380.1 hypothetical protein OC861_002009 [Tilletia horrida]